MATTAQAGTLLEKVSSPGFVMSSYAIVKKCSITDNGQMVQQYQLHEMASKRTTPLVLAKGSIKIKISEAALGTINTEGMPVDGPTISYRAYQKQAGSALKTVLLYEENGGSGQKSTNDSPSAVALRNFIDVNCGDPLVY
jgi:hypothetical protein